MAPATAHAVADVRAAEEAVLARTGDGTLMQRAAAALAATCAGLLRGSGNGRVTGRRVVLLVGGGNNGGDALWAGARLAGRGAQVTAVLTGDRAHPGGLAALRAAGGAVLQFSGAVTEAGGAVTEAGGAVTEAGGAVTEAGGAVTEAGGAVTEAGGAVTEAGGGVTEVGTESPARLAMDAVSRADLVVDGLVGLGARPGLREPAAALVAAIPPGAAVVAVDLPSGVDPDTGEVPGPHVHADVTVTFGAGKPCLLLPPASVAAGRLQVVDLGFGPELPVEPLVERLTESDVGRLWPVPAPGSDKYRRGVLGVVAGSAGYPGAAVLAVSGALRSGLGMVRYVGPRDATAAVLAAWPEVVAGTGRVRAWLLGPGVSPDAGDDQPAAIAAALEGDEPCVLDAGALTVLVSHLAQERDARVAHAEVPDRSHRLLLTPHAGELARLLTDLGEPADRQVRREDVERQPYQHACRAAELTGATVLLKGSTTLVVRPDGRARSQAEAPSWLATAGAGDVLAGIAGALLAGGLTPFDAGAVAALVHGVAAGDASQGGPIVSGDVAGRIPATVATCLRGDGRLRPNRA